MSRLELTADPIPPREPDPVSDVLLRRARVVSEVMFESDDGPPSAERLDWVEQELRSFLGYAGAQARLVMGASLFVVSVIAPLLLGKFSSLGSLSFADRRRALERLEKSLLSLAFLGAKAILCIVYYEHPDAAREIGSDGLCMKSTPRLTMKVDT